MSRKTYYQRGKPVGYEWKKKPSRDTGEALVLGTFFVALVAVTLVYWNHINNMNKYNNTLKNKKNRGEIDMATCVCGPRRNYYMTDKVNTSDQAIITNYPKKQEIIYA